MSYEVEHGVDLKEKKGMRPDMSTFTARFAETQSTSSNTNRYAEATPADNSDLFRLLEDQLSTIYSNSSDPTQRSFLESLLESTHDNTLHPPRKIEGLPQSFLDTLDRVDKKSLKQTDMCGICGEAFLEDEFPLVVELPCSSKVPHMYDMDCIAPWLKLNGTCPMDREDLRKRKAIIPDPEPEEEEWDDQFA